MMTFEQFFKTATEHAPYDYQQRLAGGDHGCLCESKLIHIPTGLGKTAAVVMAWLWNRVTLPVQIENPPWPRRLVYCLPMRTLVEQTRENAAKWLEKLLKLYPENTERGWMSATLDEARLAFLEIRQARKANPSQGKP